MIIPCRAWTRKSKWAGMHYLQLRIRVCVCACVCASYHAVHCEVVVLGLQLYGVGVVIANLCVACQEQTLVVHDPVKHLSHGE